MILMNRPLILSLLFSLGCSSNSETATTEQERVEETATQAVSNPLPTESYEEILYELGAFPVSKLTKSYWNNGNPGEVFSLGRRVDVNGWLPPEAVRSNEYLTESEKKRYGIPRPPLSYERYVTLMDVEIYQQSKDPLLFAVIKLTLDEFGDRRMKIRNPADFVKIYHARIGLDSELLWLFKRENVSGEVFARMYQQQQDPLVFHYLPPLKTGQEEYRMFLDQQLVNPQIRVEDRFQVYTQLYHADQQKHLQDYQAFLISNVDQPDDWFYRWRMNEALLEIGTPEAIQVVNQSLLNDPVAEVRECILHHLKEQGQIDEFIDTILLLSNGKGQPCTGVMPNRMFLSAGENEISYDLSEYLKWAQEQNYLKRETKHKVKIALQALASKKPEPVSTDFGDRFEVNDLPQKN
tara:strand:+ start:39 stop:1262 length:1224 start_codon:yes stop_codon:yes gene_type:complete